jgi:amino acid transporter
MITEGPSLEKHPTSRHISTMNQEGGSPLKRSIGTGGIFAIASGAMISSGIFVLPSVAYEQAGPSIVVAYALAGVLALLGMLSIVELATGMPKAGGDYFFITRSLGPVVGTISGMLSWFALSAKAARVYCRVYCRELFRSEIRGGY